MCAAGTLPLRDMLPAKLLAYSQPRTTILPTIPSVCCYKQQGINSVLKKYNFLPNDDPIDIRPSPCPSQAPHGSAFRISPPYIVPFPSLWRTDAKATFNYLVERFLIAIFQMSCHLPVPVTTKTVLLCLFQTWEAASQNNLKLFTAFLPSDHVFVGYSLWTVLSNSIIVPIIIFMFHKS